MKAPEFRPFVKEDFAEAPWMEKLLRPLNTVLTQVRSGLANGLTFAENLNAEIKTVDVGGGSAAVAAVAAAESFASATVDVTSGAPGTVALRSGSTAENVSGVSIETVSVGISLRVVRFTFATAMPDTNYTVNPAREYPPIGTTAIQPIVIARTTGSFDVGFGETHTNGWYHVDNVAHSFSVLTRHPPSGGSAGSNESPAFPLRFQTRVKNAKGVLLLKAVQLSGRDQIPVPGLGGVGWAQSGNTVTIESVTGLVGGSTYRLTLAILGG